MKKPFLSEISFAAILLLFALLVIGGCSQSDSSDEKDLVSIFHHYKKPSMEALKAVNEFFEAYADKYEIKYYDIKDDDNNELLVSLGLPEDHFPIAIAINGKTSAKINGEVIVFAKLPDLMHHVGENQGNWTFDHLKTVLENKDLLQPDNPIVIP